jgi:hypothetical protein
MAAKRPARTTRPKRKVPKKPIRKTNPRASDGGTVWVEILPPTWLERINDPVRGRKNTVKKRPSATEFLLRFRLGRGKKPR